MPRHTPTDEPDLLDEVPVDGAPARPGPPPGPARSATQSASQQRSTSTMTTPSANDLLMGGGIPSARFPVVGTTVTGIIVREPTVRQQTDFDTGAPKFF